MDARRTQPPENLDLDDPACTVLANGNPKRREDILYQNEEYYGRLGNFNSRENSVEDDEAGPSGLANTVKPNGRPKRREDLMYVNNTDTGEEYYSRADSRCHSSDEE